MVDKKLTDVLDVSIFFSPLKSNLSSDLRSSWQHFCVCLVSVSRNCVFCRIGQKVVHWHNKLRLSVMETPITFDRMSVPQEIYQFLKIQSESGGAMKYSPLLFIDNLSAKRNEFVPLRSQVVNMTLEYTPISVGKIRIIAMISGSLEQLKGFGLQESDLEDVVAIFTETNFYILAFTIMVTVLHLVFDFLAFKNDINFWRKRDTVVGLSGRTILWRAFSQIIVFLYLLDEKSSLLISIPAGIACFIEMWKVLKLWKFAGMVKKILWSSEHVPS